MIFENEFFFVSSCSNPLHHKDFKRTTGVLVVRYDNKKKSLVVIVSEEMPFFVESLEDDVDDFRRPMMLH